MRRLCLMVPALVFFMLLTAHPVLPYHADLTVPPRYDYYFYLDLDSDATLSFSFSVSSWRGADDIGFTLVSSTRAVLLDVGRVSQYSGSYTAVFSGGYYLRFDNSYSILTTKDISLSYSIIPPSLNIESYEWADKTITGSLRNSGASNIDTKNARASLNGTQVGGLGGTCAQTSLSPAWTCTFSITVPNASWVLGKAYVLIVSSSTGNFSFPLVAGGNSASLIQTEPTMITFQTVNLETNTYQSQSTEVNQGILSQDYFVKNTFAMIGALAGGILLVGAILGLFAISIASRNSGKGLYGEDANRAGDSRRNIPILMIIALGAFGLLTVSVLTPLLGFNVRLLYSRAPFLLTGVLALIFITSILGFAWIAASILRGRRASLTDIEADTDRIALKEDTLQTSQIPVQAEPMKEKKCRYCGAVIPRDGAFCRKCGMPAVYMGAD